MSSVPSGIGPDTTERELEIRRLKEKISKYGLSPVDEGLVLGLHNELLESQGNIEGLTSYERKQLPWFRKWSGIVFSRRQNRNQNPSN
ncbi:MAG: hypothetical protein COT91_05510 [Candidatus Doudnabacteria bacterium CG10_big_fil_rev_8_21_14_0_10_41_10]|uniref:Uncharacterized protein n=1 Tax=Candidatus Doudnabacteria bacterium CG10_big_fil_rev_8_21_14_0_10_41_10 TaxID=1974551 RepID=A0A2H0VC43_9BACT|nr:MAG: hypothetical protein COT91_05510 [Candidatus Doudnabacteria bacterium CG10_big_fil_rev_8_21_14_0_10_41_10]